MSTDVEADARTSTATSGTATTGAALANGMTTAEGTTAVDPDDPREHIEVGVLMPNGRLVGRRFASRAEAEAWARPEAGEQVVEYNLVCECSV